MHVNLMLLENLLHATTSCIAAKLMLWMTPYSMSIAKSLKVISVFTYQLHYHGYHPL